MAEFLLFVIFLQGLIFGVFCSYIAGQKNRNRFSWFVLGYLFSILAMLTLVAVPKIENKVKVTAGPSDEIPLFDGNRDITSPKYQLFLTKRYSIEKNSTLEKFVIEDSVFNTLADSLRAADASYGHYLSQKSYSVTEKDKAMVMIFFLVLAVAISYGIWEFKHPKDVNQSVNRPEGEPQEPAKTQEPTSRGTEVSTFAVFERKPIFIDFDAVTLEEVKNTIGFHPTAILRIDAVRAQLQVSLGANFGAFERDLSGPAGLVSKVGDDIFGSACMAHFCPGNEVSIAVNTKTGAVVVGVQNEGKVTVFGAVDMSHSPSSIRDWLKDIRENS